MIAESPAWLKEKSVQSNPQTSYYKAANNTTIPPNICKCLPGSELEQLDTDFTYWTSKVIINHKIGIATYSAVTNKE